MIAVPRVLTIQDMSSIGRCALTVMIPIISAMRCQAVPLATAVLSNHLEYPHYEFVDLSAHMRDFMDCWDKNEIDFHAIVSGFLASPEQIHLVEEAIDRFASNGQMVIVDPAMADDGRLYSIYTEACFLLDIPFSTNPISEDELRERCKQLHHMGPEMVIMTSVPSKTHAVIAVYDGPTDFLKTYSIPLVPVKATGTGDIFTAVLSGAVMRGYSPYDAAELAMNFTTNAIQATLDTVQSLKHGVAFELVLPELTQL